MQFGIFSVSDITRNAVTGETPSEAKRIQDAVAIAKKADEVGLDIFKRLKAEEARLGAEKPLVIPYDSENVYYEFDTEFWNDELHSYEFFINSRCFEATGGAAK